MEKQFLKLSVLLLACSCLFMVLGCKSMTNMINDATKSADTQNPKSLSGNSTDSQTTGNLDDDLIGTWSGSPERDLTITFTFNKDGTFAEKEAEAKESARTINGTYTIIDDETVEMKVPNQPTIRAKIKITGDAMQFAANNRTLTLKRSAS